MSNIVIHFHFCARTMNNNIIYFVKEIPCSMYLLSYFVLPVYVILFAGIYPRLWLSF